MGKNNIEDIYPLSPVQQGILFHTLSAPKSGMYFEQVAYNLQGNLDVSAFADAWQRVVDRHSILRTLFLYERRKDPLQVVCQRVKLPWARHDWPAMTKAEQQERLEIFLQADRDQGFELSRAPLMRLALIQVSDDVYYFVWSSHHLLLDRWSSSLVVKEVIALYKALLRRQDLQPDPTRPYRDYIAWLSQRDLSEAEVFWRQRLKGFTEPTGLGIARSEGSPPDQEVAHERLQIRLSAATTTALQSLAQRCRVTLNTIVQGAWALLLSRYSREGDVVFGAVVSGRPTDLAGVETMVGLLINTLPVRVHISSEDLLLPWLKQLQDQMVELRQHEYSPLVQVQRWSEIPRGFPLFESILAFENSAVGGSLEDLGESLEVRIIRYEGGRTNYPLTVFARPGRELLLGVIYDRRRFDADAMTRMTGHLQTLLEGMLVNPEQRVSDLPLLTDAERNQLSDWNNTRADYAKDRCIHELFEAQVEQTPDAVAITFEGRQLTYRELNARSNQLAHFLVKRGVGPEVMVGICVERSMEMVIGLLGILKAGGAYVPLDPEYPKDRLAFMLEDARVAVLLTPERLIERLPQYAGRVLCLESCWDSIMREEDENPGSGLTPNNLAYVIYTSGSTGKPKGAMNTHQGIWNCLLSMQQAYQLTSDDRVLQKTPFSFDVSVLEFFWPLLAGGRLVLARPGGHRDSAYLVKLIAEEQITTIIFVPSMLHVFLKERGLETCRCLKLVICGGEALPLELQERFFAQLGAELHNIYGPTEAAVAVTFWACEPKSSRRTVPIGRPIANTRMYILDSLLRPVPAGVPGELHIGGVGLGRGYLGRPELTAEKFIPNPFGGEAGARLYKTGDLARYMPDGTIEYLGRTDHQVKIRGFRIELGEVESMLGQHPAVRQAVVLAREDVAGEKRLVAYLVGEGQTAPSRAELRHFLQERLPEYMVPSAFVTLDALPLTPNGKLDRWALPAPHTVRSNQQGTTVGPRDSLELQLVQMWEEILAVHPVGVTDNFFELGGHSLLAMRLMGQIERQFGRRLSLSALFQGATIDQLASILRRPMASVPRSPVVGVHTKGSLRPFFCVHPAGGPSGRRECPLLS
jgi:amino acid adenylation domain-containing protein